MRSINNANFFRCNGVCAPCKDCKNRHEGCHGECEEYISFCEKRKRLSEENEKHMKTYKEPYSHKYYMEQEKDRYRR